MKLKLFISCFAIFHFCGTSLIAQENVPPAGKNLVKFNLSPLVLNSYVIQYERVVGRKQSVGLSFGYSPAATLPFKQLLIDRYGSNEDVKQAIQATKYQKFNATLEYRFYTGRQAARGFYLAPFARYVKMNLDENYRFKTVDSIPHNANLKSDFSGIAVGLLAGYQWIISQHFALDFWIAGPFYGPTMKANFHGYDPIGNLSEEDQAELERRIENGNIPGYKIDASVSQNTSGPTMVDVKMKGPYYGIRALGVCLVYHF